MICIKCGKENGENFNSCIFCGNELSESQDNEEMSDNSMPKRIKVEQSDNMDSQERASERAAIESALKDSTRTAGVPFLVIGIIIIIIAFLLLEFANTIVTFLWVVGAAGVIIGLYLMITGGGKVSQKDVDDIHEDMHRK